MNKEISRPENYNLKHALKATINAEKTGGLNHYFVLGKHDDRHSIIYYLFIPLYWYFNLKLKT